MSTPITDRPRSTVPVSVLVVAGLLAAALSITILAADTRERRALPEATSALRWSVVSAAGLLSCFEGVQDDLTAGLQGAASPSPIALEQAAERLPTCDPDELDTDVAAIDLPPPAPVTDADHRALREDLVTARAALARAVLDARTAQRAMADVIEAGEVASSEFAIAFRAVQGGYETARGLLVDAEGIVARLPDTTPSG